MSDSNSPCPFCGSEKTDHGTRMDYSTTPNVHVRMVYVKCMDCHARGPSVVEGRKAGPVRDAWNKAMRPNDLITMGFATPPDVNQNMLVTDHICLRERTPEEFCNYCFQQDRYPNGYNCACSPVGDPHSDDCKGTK